MTGPERESMEIWKGLPGDVPYQVSSDGRVRRAVAGGGWPKGYILDQRPNNSGYLRVSINGEHRFVHRLILLGFVGEPPEGCEADHLNGDIRDNRILNLRWVERHKNRGAKMSPDQVLEIRERAARGEKGSDMKGDYPVSERHIRKIINRKRWGHLD